MKMFHNDKIKYDTYMNNILYSFNAKKVLTFSKDSVTVFAKIIKKKLDLEEDETDRIRFEPPHDKTNNLHMRKQWHRSAS